MKIAMTGTSGNMGRETLLQTLALRGVEKVRVLLSPRKKNDKLAKEYKRNYGDRIEILRGSVADEALCKQLVEGMDYVVHMAAVIPPRSDADFKASEECNKYGAIAMVNAVKATSPQPCYIHISTVALYGNRNSKHMWARVGDPLVISPFDIYSLTKMRGEFRVLESKIRYKTVLRQTAMLHNRMLSDNMSDGLMFHTCFNAPLEWATAEDSGLLIANIVKADIDDGAELKKKFWNKVFNIGGGLANCVTGYDVLNDGFEIIGGSVKDFFDPDFNAIRNFHGVWFYDGKKLDDMFHYQRQTTKDFWAQFKKEHGILKAGKIAPKKLIKKFAIERLFKNPNSPRYWREHNDAARMLAYFGGTARFDAIGKDWSKFPLLFEGKDELGKPLDYAKLVDRDQAPLIDIGYDPEREAGYKELRRIANMHGGKLISPKGGLYDTLEWENSDGQRFKMKGYTVLVGHWWNPSYTSYCWDWDRLAKKDRIYAQAWYDSHDANEDNFYYFNDKFEAKYGKIK